MSETTDRPIEVGPTRTGKAVATAASLAAVAGLVVAGVAAALIPAGLAAIATVAGLRRGNRRAITVAGVLGAVAVIVAGALDGRTIPVLVATGCAVVSWDAAETAVTNGQQVGRTTTTAPTERAHIAATAGVLVVGAGTAYGIYRLSRSGLSTAAVLALLAGGILLLIALQQ